MDQRGRLEGLSGTLAAQVCGREPPELVVDERQQRIDLGVRLPACRHYSTRSIVTLFITTGETGRSWRPVGTEPILRTTSRPSTTAPNTE